MENLSLSQQAANLVAADLNTNRTLPNLAQTAFDQKVGPYVVNPGAISTKTVEQSVSVSEDPAIEKSYSFEITITPDYL